MARTMIRRVGARQVSRRKVVSSLRSRRRLVDLHSRTGGDRGDHRGKNKHSNDRFHGFFPSPVLLSDTQSSIQASRKFFKKNLNGMEPTDSPHMKSSGIYRLYARCY